MYEDPATYSDGIAEVQPAAPGAAVASSGPTAGRASPAPTATGLDPARVERWAQLLDGDPEARAYLQRHLGDAALVEAQQRIAELSAERERLVLMHRYGIDAELGELHLTAVDPQVLEQQARSLAALLRSGERASTDALLQASGEESVTPNPAQPQRAVPPSDQGSEGSASEDARSELPTYGVPASREELLEEQFRRLYRA